MRVENETKEPKTTSTLWFTKKEVKNALIAFAEEQGHRFDVSADDLRLHTGPDYPRPDGDLTELSITRMGTKPAIW